MSNLDKVANALLGFSAGVQGQAPQFLQQLREREKQTNLAQLGQDMAAGKIDQAQYLKNLAQYDPTTYGKLALAQIGVDQPADVRSWLYRNNLPTEQQAQFDSFRRAPQWLNTGGAFVNPATNNAIPVTPKPEEMPTFKGAQAEATAGGKVKGENIANAELNYPDFAAGVNNQLAVIDQMIGNKNAGIPEHPGLEQAVGGIASRLPSLRDNTLDFENLLEQSKSEAFLSSIKQMQGFGALSNEEGAKATTAATRMKTASSVKGFKDAAQEYRNIITSGLERMQKKVGIAPKAAENPSGAEKVVEKLDQSALPMPNDKNALKANQIYKTPRGVALWDGEKFIQD